MTCSPPGASSLCSRRWRAFGPFLFFFSAPPCSSWVFFSLPSTGRALDPSGDPSKNWVVSQNALVERVLLISVFARARGVSFIWEQPSTTRMFKYPAVEAFRERAPDCSSCKLNMGAYGLLAEKLTILFGNAPYLPVLSQRVSHSDRLGIQLRSDRLETSHRYTDSEGRARCQGGKHLKATQAYPLGFGAAHALAFKFSEALPQPAFDPLLLEEDPWFLRDLKDPNHKWELNAKREAQVPLARPRSRSPR